MHDLTSRQVDILKKIIDEFTNTAEPVGSETLEKKYDLGVSPATIRNEMARMAELGYLSKPHSSAGRIPTSKALKLYVVEIMKEKNLTVAEEVEAKEKIWDFREKEVRFLREATRNLAQKTKMLAVSATDDGDVFYSGYANILEMPEFYDIDITKNLLSVLDDFKHFEALFKRFDQSFSVLFGEDFSEEILRPYSFIIARFQTKQDNKGLIGVIGPCRVKFEIIVPVVKYYGDLIGKVAGW